MKRLPLFLMAGALCACMTARVDMRYAPAEEFEPIRAARMPKIFVSPVEDRAGGFQYHGMGATRSGALTRPLTETIHEAVSLELTRSGVPTTGARAGSDAVLKTAVLAANETTAEGVNSPVNATLSLSMQLRSLDGDLLWSNELGGRGMRTVLAAGVPGVVPTQTMNDALLDLMRKFHRALEEERVLDRVFRAPAGAAAVAAAPPPPAAKPVPVSDLDSLPAGRASNPKAYAVVIGVEHYREKLPNADYAAGDAALAAKYFQRSLGVPEANLVLLTDEHATKGDFEKYFERWLPNRVEKGDTVFVYYSGHGAPNPSKGDAYLVPYDGDPTYIDQTGFAVKRLFDDLAKLPAERVFVAMDSCFSGAGGRSVIAKGARPLVSVVADAVPAKVTVLAASAGDQISNSYAAKGHGLFTYFLLKGLKEKGGDLRAAFDYLKPEVERTARREYNSDQEPQWEAGR